MKEGVSPSFIVSIRGVKRIAALRCLWQIQQSRNFRSRAIFRAETLWRDPEMANAARRWEEIEIFPLLCPSLFFPFSLGQAREKGIVFPRPLHEQRENGH